MAITSASPKLLHSNKNDSSKKNVFWSNCYKIEVMITSAIETVELPNFGLMTKSTIQFEATFVCDVIARNYDIITFTLKHLYFKKA